MNNGAVLEATIYPNPATNENVNVSIISGDEGTAILMKLVDMTGREYYRNEVPGTLVFDQKIVPSIQMTPGVYFMLVKQGSHVAKQKFIIR